MSGEMKRVGVREFREGLAEYLASSDPVAVTRHGQTVGYFLPKRRRLSDEEMDELGKKLEEVRRLFAEVGLDEEEVIRQFKARKRRGK